MFQRIVPDVLEKYGVSYVTIASPQKGYRNESYAVELDDGTWLNLLFFKREPQILERIKRADAASAWAASRGLPVRTRFDERLLKLRADTYAGLYTYLPGRTIAWEMYSMKHIKLLGWAMGDLHRALEKAPPQDKVTIYEELEELLVRMQRYFAVHDVRQAAAEKLGLGVDTGVFDGFTERVRHLSNKSGQQMLHMDMVRGNVLFDRASADNRWQIDDVVLTGVIDFEKAVYGHPVCDVARTLAFLLVDCPKPHQKVMKYFLESGYSKRAGVNLAYREELAPLVSLFLLHDFYKFLRHTPYESLADNHHYVRTKDLLLKYGMISPKS